VVAISTDWRKAKLSPADHTMLEFGEKLSVIPSAMAASDLETLRQAGFSEPQIIGVAAAAAYRNFITRIADGLGVELGTAGGDYYDSQVLRAFGVTDSAVGGTLYADRQDRSERAADSANRLGARPAHARIDDGQSCWIGTDAESLAHLPSAISQSTAFRNLAGALSLKPDTLKATFEFAHLVDLGGSGLGERSEAIIGTVVAAVLGLSYLGAHHAQRLLDAGATPADLRALVDNPAGDTLRGRERAAAHFCEKLTRAPGTMARADVETLRAAGFDDRGIVTIVAAAAFANYCGRLAAALGVGPEAQLSEAARSAI
jgi:uncharacterized peroxidase-related enzyme